MKPGPHNRSQRVILLLLLERKALIKPFMTIKIICQLELRDWLAYRGQQKPLLITVLNVMGVFFVLSNVSIDI